MWAAEWQHNATRHSCGHQRHVCSDPTRSWYPQRDVCFAEMNEAAARSKYEELHEERPFHNGDFTRWSAERTAATPYRFNEGVTIYVAPTDLNPDDDFLTAPDLFGRAPFTSAGGGPDGSAS